MAHLIGEAQWQDDDRSGTYKNLWISKENIDYKQGDDICKMYNLSGSERFQPRCTKYNKLSTQQSPLVVEVDLETS